MSPQTNRKGVSIEEKKLIVSRTFPAPRPLVFETYSSCTHLKEWWGPRTWPMVECSLEFKEGGRWHYCLRGPKPEDTSWGLGIYETIRRPETLIYRDYFSNEASEINEEMPGMLISIEFQEKGEETTVVSTTEFDSNETRDSIIEMGAIDGFTETWDRLEEYLSK